MIRRLLFLLLLTAVACRAPQRTHTAAALPGGERTGGHPLSAAGAPDTLLNAAGSARTILLGESTHGTSEFYQVRAQLSLRFIERGDVRAIALEGDWADLERLDRVLRGPGFDSTEVRTVLRSFRRWPRWLWANEDFLRFAQWLQWWNRGRPPDEQVRVAGLDLFGFPAAGALPAYPNDTLFNRLLPGLGQCLAPYKSDALAYEAAVRRGASCAEAALLLRNAWVARPDTGTWTEALFRQQQSIATLLEGERHFRERATAPDTSWNLRDRHMAATIGRLRRWLGPQARILVWAHNTHTGDARATDMPARGRSNLTALLRATEPGAVFSIGFGTYRGTVLAGARWGAPAQVLPLWPAREGSLEAQLHAPSAGDRFLLRADLARFGESPVLQRAVGVMAGDAYTPSVIARRWDAFVFIDSSHALVPLR